MSVDYKNLLLRNSPQIPFGYRLYLPLYPYLYPLQKMNQFSYQIPLQRITIPPSVTNPRSPLYSTSIQPAGLLYFYDPALYLHPTTLPPSFPPIKKEPTALCDEPSAQITLNICLFTVSFSSPAPLSFSCSLLASSISCIRFISAAASSRPKWV